jgi:hypothetical protein
MIISHAGGQLMPTLYHSTHVCWICGLEVSLEDCKIDERGNAVHEECLIAKTKMEAESSRLGTNRGFHI